MGLLLATARRKAQKLSTAKQAVDAQRLRQAALDKAAAAPRQSVLNQTARQPIPVLKQSPSLPKPTSSTPPPRLPQLSRAQGGYVSSENTILGRHVPRPLRKRAVQQPQLVTKASQPPRTYVIRRKQQPQTVTVRRRQRQARPKNRIKLDASRYGDIHSLSSLLGLNETEAKPAVLVSVDTESEHHGLNTVVVEIGITILDTRDILGLQSGDHIRNWIEKMRHYHLVLDITRKPKVRMRENRSFFSTSQFVSTGQAGMLLRNILRESITRTDPSSDAESDVATSGFNNTVEQIILVGQSISGDVASLRGSPLNINLHDPSSAGVGIASIYDTLALTSAAQTARNRLKEIPAAARIPARLGPLVTFLGVDPQYINPETPTNVAGTHNAGNDAAYTMMALLLYALRWRDVTYGIDLPSRMGSGRAQSLSDRQHFRAKHGRRRERLVQLAGVAFVTAAFAVVFGGPDI